jgi:recombination protein RecA
MADAFESILAKAQKKYNLSVGPLSQIAQEATFITTGNIAIDHIIGGGLPLGRSVELAGPPSSGKTTTALQTAAALQKVIIAGGDPEKGIKPTDKILYLDYEQTIDQEYAKALGLDIDHDSFLLTQPDTLEDGANVAIELIQTGRIRLVIWDSVAAMMPSAKAEAEIGKSLPAVQAKLMSDLGQKLNPLLYEHQTLNIFVNHLKEVLDMSGRRPAHLGPKLSTPGGIALKFYASVRVEYKQIMQIKEKGIDPLSGQEVETPGATNVEVKVTKNKVAPPFRKAVVRVRFGKGFDNFWTAMQILLAGKAVMYSAGYYYFHKVEDDGLAPEWMERAKTGTQRPNIRTDKKLFEAADEHPEWRDAVIAYAAEFVKNNKLVMKAVTPEEEAEAEAEEQAMAEILPVNSDGNRVSI